MAKLKCWKKTYDTKHGIIYQKGKDRYPQITIMPKYLSSDDKTLEIVSATRKSIRVVGTAKTKPRAIKFAKSYMKKHDICRL